MVTQGIAAAVRHTGIRPRFCFILPIRTHGAKIMTQGTVQLIAGILAVVLVAIIILRRKSKKKDEDEF